MSHEYPYSIKRHGTTLEKCEDEPVRTPGCIQAHGVLLALRLSDLTILQVSENSEGWLSLSPGELLGKGVALAVGESAAHEIRSVLEQENVENAPLYVATLKPKEAKNGQALHLSLHTCMGLALVELEDARACGSSPSENVRVEPDYYGLVRKSMTRFQKCSGITQLSQSITEELRRVTGLDRVMVYRFHADDSGEVIAESKRGDQSSWLGWRYPAHDIPRPAREIFSKIWSRPVPDIRSELVEMVPLLNPDTRTPLDMTYCALRGASVMYTEYLDNMGIRAALTLSLRRDGKLWGLIACHHDTPMLMSYRVRAAAEFLAQGASQQLLLAEEREDSEYRVKLEAANYALISKVALATDLSAFVEGSVHLGSALDCGGAAILYQGSWNKVGRTPEIQEMTDVGLWLQSRPECQQKSKDPIFVTDHLSNLYPQAKDFAGVASGLIAFCFSQDPLGLVFFFKPETLQTLTWAGNPNELPVLQGPNGPRLSPRKSFEMWRETVTDRSMPWKTVEVDSIQKLRGLVIDMLVSKAEQLNTLRLRVAERTHELAQTNHELVEAQEAVARELAVTVKTEQELKEALKQLRENHIQTLQLEKLSSIGQLAAGVAHEINTPMQFLGDNTHFLKESFQTINGLLASYEKLAEAARANGLLDVECKEASLKESEADMAYLCKEIPGALDQSIQGISRVTKLVSAMKTFSHPGQEEKKNANLNEGITATVTISHNQWKYSSELVTELASDLPNLPCIISELNQVILNMIINATHSIEDAIQKQVITRGIILIKTFKENDNAVILIEDNGMGISPEVISKIFDPFFTTKQVGKGTGQGLAITYDIIVNKHQGTIHVTSQPRKGACFRITLPFQTIES